MVKIGRHSSFLKCIILVLGIVNFQSRLSMNPQTKGFFFPISLFSGNEAITKNKNFQHARGELHVSVI